MSPLRVTQQGLTLLEILIALSIFAVIGSASYQVLDTTLENQKVGQRYSSQLARQQRAMSIIDSDLQQLIQRDIRKNAEEIANYLIIDKEENTFEFSRSGRRNPLALPRSHLLRITYDVGLHPQVANNNSPYYKDERFFFRRHIWSHLDRVDQTTVTIQALLADVDAIKVSVLTDSGRQFYWPPPTSSTRVVTGGAQLSDIKALEITWKQDGYDISRLYKVL